MFDTIHNHYHGLSDEDRRRVIDILKKINNMATKAEVLAIAAEIGEALTNIGDDITRLVDANADNIPDDVVAEFRALADRAKAVADRTPEADVPEEPETPEEPGDVTQP